MRSLMEPVSGLACAIMIGALIKPWIWVDTVSVTAWSILLVIRMLKLDEDRS